MSAVEERNRQKIGEADADRDQGRHAKERRKPDRRRLARYPRDADRASELVDRFPADLLAVCSEGDHFDRPAARFREQDEAPFDPGDPERRARFVGELDALHRSARDPEQWKGNDDR